MKNSFGFTVVGLALVFGMSTAGAEELLVTEVASGSQQNLALDFATDGKAVALQFKVQLPKGVDAKRVDLSRCLSDLPATHSGQCVYMADKHAVLGLVYSDSNEALKAGVVSIGEIAYDRGLNKRGIVDAGAAAQVIELLVSDADAKSIPAKSSVHGDSKIESGDRKAFDAKIGDR